MASKLLLLFCVNTVISSCNRRSVNTLWPKARWIYADATLGCWFRIDHFVISWHLPNWKSQKVKQSKMSSNRMEAYRPLYSNLCIHRKRKKPLALVLAVAMIDALAFGTSRFFFISHSVCFCSWEFDLLVAGSSENTSMLVLGAQRARCSNETIASAGKLWTNDKSDIYHSLNVGVGNCLTNY